MSRQPVSARVVNSVPFVLVAFVATVVPAVAFFLSASVREWIETHGMTVFWIAVVLIAVLVAALELQRREVPPDQRDIALMERFRAELGAGEGGLVSWVRNDMSPNRFSEARWRQLEDAHRNWTDDGSRRFRDKKVQAEYEATMDALVAYMTRTGDDVWSRFKENDEGNLGIPNEWREGDKAMRERWQNAVDDIAAGERAFLAAHENFLKTAHHRGL